jgi:hypothetical protein
MPFLGFGVVLFYFLPGGELFGVAQWMNDRMNESSPWQRNNF